MTKRNKTIAILLTSALLGAGAAGTVAAKPWGGDSSHACAHAEKRGGMHGVFKQLDLTEAQRDQLFELRHNQRPAMREKYKQLREGRQTLRELASAEEYDATQVKNAADQQARIRSELIVMRTETMHKMMQVLTPEQKQKLAQARQERKDRTERD